MYFFKHNYQHQHFGENEKQKCKKERFFTFISL